MSSRRIEAHLYTLAVLGVLASVVGAYYYLRIVKIMYFDEPAPAFDGDMGLESQGDPDRLQRVRGVVCRLRRPDRVDRRGQCQSARAVNAGPAWPVGYALKHFEEIDSTNEEARRLAGAGERGPIWIAADRQNAGRGRRGRNWDSPNGNLAATLFLRPEKPAADCAQLSFVAAIAGSDMVSRYAGDAAIKVKWPNDVLADGRKIAGILLESASAGGANGSTGSRSVSASISQSFRKAWSSLRHRSPPWASRRPHRATRLPLSQRRGRNGMKCG